MSSTTTYLITGANRGIGHALTVALLLRPYVTVIGTVRSSASRFSLELLPTGEGSSLIIATLDISKTSAEEIEKSTKQLYENLLKEGVRSIDILIASAGLGTAFHPIQNTTLSSVTEHFFINTLGPLSLFQSLRPLLLPDTLPEGEGEQGYKRKEKKFIVISSSLGSIGDMEKDTRSLAYGISKAGVNYLVRKCHFEEEGVVSGAVHPGWVKTENGQNFADSIGYEEPPMSLEDSVRGVLEQIDGATKETTSGTFVSYDGSRIAW